MDKVSVLWLGGDFLASLGGIYVLKEFFAADDNTLGELAFAIGSGFGLDILFFTGQSPMIMLLHSVVAGFVAWYFWADIVGMLPTK